MKTNKKQTGSTLIELMITITAASIIMLIIAFILVMAFQSWRINNAYADLRRDVSLAVYLMARDIRESNITNVTEAAAGRLTLSAHPPARNNAVTYTKSADTLNSTALGTIIPRRLQTFIAESSSLGDGVYLTIVLTNSLSGIINPGVIAITNEVFVNTRN